MPMEQTSFTEGILWVFCAIILSKADISLKEDSNTVRVFKALLFQRDFYPGKNTKISTKSVSNNHEFQNTSNASETLYAKEIWMCFITDISLRTLQRSSQLTKIHSRDEKLSLLKANSSAELVILLLNWKKKRNQFKTSEFKPAETSW